MSERGYTLSEQEHQKFMENYRQYCEEMRKAFDELPSLYEPIEQKGE